MSRRYNGLDFNRKPKKKIDQSHLHELISWIFWLSVSGIIGFVLIYVFGLRTNVIGNAMEPSLYSGQQILINRMIYNISSPERGDVVAFLPNGNEDSHFYIRRVIGVPGDTVKIVDGYIYIDDVLLDEEGAYDKIANPGILENPITLSEDQFIVFGDNRNFSEDSRSGNIGIVESSYLVGKVWFKISNNLEFMGFVR
ncbi:MAG: signal peptidase I [Lachnospiraceae bacterium]|nr:signal peptidase I [Lachnospiraceae bacterium]